MGWAFCPACSQAVLPTPSTICARCGRVLGASVARCAQCRAGGLDALILVRGAAMFQSPLRAAIHAFKYESRMELAGLLARYLVTVFARPPWPRIHPALDAVVPVPLHVDRLRERGYNQSELLAAAFARRIDKPCAPEWIARVRATLPQVGLNVAARQANVDAAFVAAPHVRGKTILLVDDVFTTGATLQACAVAARLAGAQRVYGLTLAAASSLD